MLPLAPMLLTAALSAAATTDHATAAVEIVETWPLETDLDHPEIRDAHVVWLEMIERAEQRIDLAEFYASNQPDSRLETIVQALERAAERGVRVRFLSEERFYRTYPETLDRLAARDGIEMRRYDAGAVMGGVLHAKYFLVDGAEAYVGSQNFDWRALAHIQELGVRVRIPDVVAALVDVFEADWALAGGAGPKDAIRASAARTFPAEAPATDGAVRVTPVASPTGFLPDEDLWDLPRIVALIDGAERSLHLQLLTYKTGARDGTHWDELDRALRRAAHRGVQVHMLLADWSKRRGTIESLQSLEPLPNLEVRLVTIPEHSSGFIPYARVAHAKFLVADGDRAWVGTSNWEKSYFHTGRNVGLVIEGASVVSQLERFFTTGWTSAYAEPVDPKAEYRAPRIGE